VAKQSTSGVVLMDFWAPWCGPCKKMEPILEKLKKDYGGRLEVTQVNVDEHPELALKYQVMAVPTLLLVKGDEEVARIIGIKSYKEVKEEIEGKL